ncbi:MAG: hypothetical protein H6729_13095 [Deltaproteobacteria bacterium]|nr:hypothetical protein [Deltaproteobacteria bacterium]
METKAGSRTKANAQAKANAGGGAKAKVVAALRAATEEDLRKAAAVQREATAGAIHEEARSEGSKDTRAIEQQYLARGLAVRVEELREGLAALSSMSLVDFPPGSSIALSALVTLTSDEGEAQRYLLAPAEGGRKLTLDGKVIRIVTPKSPLGAALMGRRVEETVLKGGVEWAISRLE